MEKKMENELETGGIRGLSLQGKTPCKSYSITRPALLRRQFLHLLSLSSLKTRDKFEGVQVLQP